MIQIVSKKDGFRRAGVAHPGTPTNYPDDHFDEAQLKALKDEPMLVVSLLPDLPEADSDDDEDDATHAQDAGPTMEAMAAAAGKAIADGKTIGSGAPAVDAMEEILGVNISSEERDAAWAAWKAGNS